MAKKKTKGELMTIEQAQEIIQCVPAKLETTEKFLADDHWQKGSGWVGWMPDESTETGQRDMSILAKTFTFKNVMKGMINRLVGAIFGKEPNYDTYLSDKATQNKVTQSIDAVMVKWWEEKRVHEKLKEFTATKNSYGKALLRIHIPYGYLTEQDGKLTVPVKSWEDALNYIYVDCPKYCHFNNVIDSNYGTEVVVVKTPYVKDSGEKKDAYEIYFLTPTKTFIIRQLVENEKEEAPLELDLGGHTLTWVAGDYDKALLNDSQKSMQRQVNHAKTMEGFALQNINFPETVFLNASLKKETVVNSRTGKAVDVLKDIVRGVGRWMNLKGIITYNPDGSEAYAPADVKWRQPADPEKFAKVADNNTRDMHETAGMLYVHQAGSPYPSGKSRIETMTDYLILLIGEKTLSDKTGRHLLSAVYVLAHWLASSTPEDIIFTFDTKITLGKIPVEERQLMLDEVNLRLRSRSNYQVVAEITDDPAQEDKSIETDEEFYVNIKPLDYKAPTQPTPTAKGAGA